MPAAHRSKPNILLNAHRNPGFASPSREKARIFPLRTENFHAPNRTRKCTQGEKNLLVTRQCADRIRTPVRAAPTYPIDGYCPPSGAPLRPPTAVARAPGNYGWLRGFADVVENFPHSAGIVDMADSIL